MIATKVPRAPVRLTPSTSRGGGTGVKKLPTGKGALLSKKGRSARGGGTGASRPISGRAGGGPTSGGTGGAAASGEQQKKRKYRPGYKGINGNTALPKISRILN